MVSKSPRSELLQIADSVAREKGLSVQEILEAIESGLQRAAQDVYGFERDVVVNIHAASGGVRVFCRYTVVREVGDDLKEITIEEAERRSGKPYKVGDIFEEELPSLDYGRVAAQSARRVMVRKVRESERQHHYEELKERVGEIVNVPIKHIEFGDIFVELGRAEAVLRKDQQLPRENFRVGDRIRALLVKLRPETKGPLGMLSRVHPVFLERLFEQEIPEVYDGIIKVRAIARDPGSRAKVAVYTADTFIDPIGACVGPRGNRIQSISNELKGERIDVIPWAEDLATFVANALSPAEISRIVMDEERNRLEVVVPVNQLSLAIGRGGQNVKLASQLTQTRIDIVTEEEDTERRTQESSERVKLFCENLQIDEIMAQFLLSQGFFSLEDIAFIDEQEFLSIEELDPKTVAMLQQRALSFLQKQNQDLTERLQSEGVEDAIFELFDTDVILKLVSENIKTLHDVADLSVDELLDIVDMSPEEASQIIMQARNHCFT